jgi:hypothetical protein
MSKICPLLTIEHGSSRLTNSIYFALLYITGGGFNVKNLSIVDNWANSSIQVP